MILINFIFGLWLCFIALLFFGFYLDMKEHHEQDTWEGKSHKEAEIVNGFGLIIIFVLSVLLMISVNA
jgi:hypothetical protein